MLVLGVHGNFGRSEHDAAAAIVAEGSIVAAVEEERFLRQRHAVGLMPQNAIHYCLRVAGVTIRDVDVVAFPRATWRGFGERLEAFFTYRFGYCPPMEFVDHHIAHAASAFYPSGLSRALVVSIDQAGDGIATAVYRASERKMTGVQEEGYPNSLGLFAAMLTQFLGFRSNHDEYKVMGLAAYGSPTVDMDGVLDVTDDGYRFHDELLHREALRSFPEFHVEQLPLFNQHAVKRLGSARLPGELITGRHADVAASAQRRLEEAVFAVVAHHRQPQDRALCLAGGVAQNSVLNGRLASSGWFERVYVPPAAGDAGTALGAALWVTEQGGHACEPLAVSLLGPSYDEAEIVEVLSRAGARYQVVDDPAEAAACLLAEERLVGWFQGRAEFGPRALGARSLLANPSQSQTPRRVNAVKGREQFRPFAPAVLDELGDRLISGYQPSPFMALTLPATERGQIKLRAAVHVDGSTRYQSVGSADGSFRHLLEAFNRLTGLPGVLNTSLNAGWEPIVLRPEEALAFYAVSGLEALVLGSCVLTKARR